ncbi:MAG: translation initiation factor IF-2 [Candidatus Dojkabacteria bacterium]
MSRKSKKQNMVVERVPVVAILGHVDHGKTSLLDYIRKSNIQSCEEGGITQKISIFTVPTGDSKKITFIDTPGHEAFDLMRLRGGSIADIVVLVVAANDGVKPQTIESIEIINNSTAKPIVAINKIDLPDINLEKIKRDLVNNGLLIEGMGGNIPVVEISAKTGKGVSELLDLISLVAEVEGLQEREKLPKGIVAKAYVLESIKDHSRGNISSLVLTSGDLCKGSWIGYQSEGKIKVERVKGIVSEDNENISALSCGFGGRVIGLSELLPVGSEVYILEKNDPSLLSSMYSEETVEEETSLVEDDFFEDLFKNEKEERDNSLNVLLKSSSEGSLEAIEKALSKLKREDFTVNIISSGVGDITLKDVEMARLSKAILLGFEVGSERGVEDIARNSGVLLRNYSVIYKLIEEVEEALEMVSTPEQAEEEIGNAVIKVIFTLSDGSVILGSRVKEGILKRDCKCYVVRNDEIIGEGKIKSLKKNKDVISEAKQGEECGVFLTPQVDAQEGDELYCYKVIR